MKAALNLPLLYEGSVKNLRGPVTDKNGEGFLAFEYTDAYSVFDWGRMPDQIPHKGAALAKMARTLFERLESPKEWQTFARTRLATELLIAIPLGEAARQAFRALLTRFCEEGLRTHYADPADFGGGAQDNVLWVKEVQIPRPQIETREGVQVYRYPSLEDRARSGLRSLIPLEVIFRFSCPEGSSLFSRLEKNPDWLAGFGYQGEQYAITSLRGGGRVSFPILEPFTKLEKTDRPLTLEEARSISGLTSDKLQEVFLRTAWVGAFVESLFREHGIVLADGKLEWGVEPNGEIILVDAIGPDELRLLKGGAQLSKEFLRRFYRYTPWYKEIEAAKSLAQSRGTTDWKSLAQTQPPPLSSEVLDAAELLYQTLADVVSSQAGDAGVEKLVQAILKTEIRTTSNLTKGKKRILLLGSGAREHALAWKLQQSPELGELIVAPGNPGMASAEADQKIMFWETETLKPETFSSLVARAKAAQVDLVVVGPDDPLASGVVDALEKAGLLTFGPTKAAAQIEASKSFAKSVMTAADVPTAKAHVFDDMNAAIAFLKSQAAMPFSWVLKADGLALGKGVILPATLEEAVEAARVLFPISNRLLIEERLEGEELSWFAFCDGERVSLFEPARDYKRLKDQNQGPNTGGMGAISPVPGIPDAWGERVRSQIFEPILGELKKRGCPFRGLLYAGLMVDVERDRISVIEFNARFGDPETQALLPRMTGDLLPWLEACARGDLSKLPKHVPFSSDFSVCVVGAAEGYPESPVRGDAIPMLFREMPRDGAIAFFAGVAKGDSPRGLISRGGRVLSAVGVSKSWKRARAEAFGRLKQHSFRGMQYRRDIAEQAQSLEEKLEIPGSRP